MVILYFMKLLTLSDLHLEFDNDHWVTTEFILSLNNDVDYLILAGDICSFKDMLSVFSTFSHHFKKSQILYVPGNHEFAFCKRKEHLYPLFKEIMVRHPNVHIFYEKNDILFEHNGNRFIGGTMWYEVNSDVYFSCPDWFDFAYILDKPADFIQKQNRKFTKYIEENIDDQTIVITHMLPSHKCVAPQYENSFYNKFFVNNVQRTIMEKQPKLWVYGHTHVSADFYIGKTRMICNPRGYQYYTENPENPDFDKNKVVEI